MNDDSTNHITQKVTAENPAEDPKEGNIVKLPTSNLS
jgi:hypothetical protein